MEVASNQRDLCSAIIFLPRLSAGEFGDIVPHAAVLGQQLNLGTVPARYWVVLRRQDVCSLTTLHCTHGASKCKTKISWLAQQSFVQLCALCMAQLLSIRSIQKNAKHKLECDCWSRSRHDWVYGYLLHASRNLKVLISLATNAPTTKIAQLVGH